MNAKWASGPWVPEEKKQINLKAYRDFVGDWKFQIYSENPINNRYVLMDEKLYHSVK